MYKQVIAGVREYKNRIVRELNGTVTTASIYFVAQDMMRIRDYIQDAYFEGDMLTRSQFKLLLKWSSDFEDTIFKIIQSDLYEPYIIKTGNNIKFSL